MKDLTNTGCRFFTDQEQQQLTIIDVFLNGDDTIENHGPITDDVNNLKLARYDVSFKEKLKFGRAKDIYDYQ